MPERAELDGMRIFVGCGKHSKRSVTDRNGAVQPTMIMRDVKRNFTPVVFGENGHTVRNCNLVCNRCSRFGHLIRFFSF